MTRARRHPRWLRFASSSSNPDLPSSEIRRISNSYSRFLTGDTEPFHPNAQETKRTTSIIRSLESQRLFGISYTHHQIKITTNRRYSSSLNPASFSAYFLLIVVSNLLNALRADTSRIGRRCVPVVWDTRNEGDTGNIP